jgi:exodeoxyribonuclease-3
VTELKVMTYNILVGGTGLGQPLSKTVEVITAAGADVVGLQEQGGSGQAIADALGFSYFNQGGSTAVLSRYPIVAASPNRWGVTIQLSDRQQANLFNAHLAPYPYQPYDIRDGLITDQQGAIAGAIAARGGQIASALADVAALGTAVPSFFTGDFNEPSHLDWTELAAGAERHPFEVSWPTSSAIVDNGFHDALRTVRPDEVNDVAYTWTPLQSPNEVHDRIDIVYYAGIGVAATDAAVVGEEAAHADIVVTPYPSDHRAVVATFALPPCSIPGDLNFDCVVDLDDWAQLQNGYGSDLAGLSATETYPLGDLNSDLAHTLDDIELFREAFMADGGAAADLAFAPVPEPTSLALLAAGLLFLSFNRDPE